MDGQLLLMDAGCERHGYASDVTRCWPVNGRFSPEQAAVYQIVQEVHRWVQIVAKAIRGTLVLSRCIEPP